MFICTIENQQKRVPSSSKRSRFSSVSSFQNHRSGRKPEISFSSSAPLQSVMEKQHFRVTVHGSSPSLCGASAGAGKASRSPTRLKRVDYPNQLHYGGSCPPALPLALLLFRRRWALLGLCDDAGYCSIDSLGTRRQSMQPKMPRTARPSG